MKNILQQLLEEKITGVVITTHRHMQMYALLYSAQ